MALPSLHSRSQKSLSPIRLAAVCILVNLAAVKGAKPEQGRKAVCNNPRLVDGPTKIWGHALAEVNNFVFMFGGERPSVKVLPSSDFVQVFVSLPLVPVMNALPSRALFPLSCYLVFLALPSTIWPHANGIYLQHRAV